MNDAPSNLQWMLDDLRQCALFAGLADGDLARIVPLLEGRAIPAGTVIVREGDPATELFIVRTGLVEVVKRAPGAFRDHRLTTLGPGRRSAS